MQIDDIRRVLVVGAGRMGTEIAVQCAVGGFDVILQDVSEAQLAKSAEWRRWHIGGFLHEGRLTPAEAELVLSRITPTSDDRLAATADLVTESAPEQIKLKRDLFARLHAVCPPHTLFTTNTSYLRPSQLAGATGRPDRFAALHFHPPVWHANVVDVMPHDGTAPEVIELLKRFAGRIGQIPIVYPTQGEGYLYNTLLRTWLLSAVTLAASGTGTFEDVDRSWMGVMRSRVGPFGILDNIGLDTVGDILSFWGMVLRDEQAKKAAAFLKPYIDAGRLGLKTMRGFYDYPDATYLRPDFLTAAMNETTETNSLIRRFMEAGKESPGGYGAQVAAEQKGAGSNAGSHSGSPPSEGGAGGVAQRGSGATDAPVASASSPVGAAIESGNTLPPDPPCPPFRRGGAREEELPQRYVLRAMPAAVHQKLKHPVRFAGPCLIVGENDSARALATRLESLGGTVVPLSLAGTLDEILARHDALWAGQSFPHLFLMTARDADSAAQEDAGWWTRRSERGVLLPFFVCQKWYSEILARNLFETATIVGATSLGGDFGASGRIEAYEGGGIAGLLKTVYLEGAVRSSLGPQVKVVDAPLDQSPELTAEQICRELALAQASVVTGSRDESRRRYVETEVGYVRGIRHLLFAERSPLLAPPLRKGGQGGSGGTESGSRLLDPGETASHPDAPQPRRATPPAPPSEGGEQQPVPAWGDFAIPPGSTWVITGGARGITESVARELARQFGLKVHLLGTTPLPESDLSHATAEQLATLEQSTRETAAQAGRDPDAAWLRVKRGIDVQRTLAAWAAEGLHATYHACNVANREQLAATLERVRQKDGPIAGVLHGAGLEMGGKLPEKQPDVVRATLAVKATGMACLMELTRNDPLQWFVAFGSLSGRFGNYAQADYAMANELLAKQLVWLRTRRPECRAVVFHWPGWTDVGMAARAEGKEGLRRGHHTFLPPHEGIAHLLRELTSDSPAAEVVIVHENEIPLEMRLEPSVGGKRAPTWQRK